MVMQKCRNPRNFSNHTIKLHSKSNHAGRLSQYGPITGHSNSQSHNPVAHIKLSCASSFQTVLATVLYAGDL